MGTTVLQKLWDDLLDDLFVRKLEELGSDGPALRRGYFRVLVVWREVLDARDLVDVVLAVVEAKVGRSRFGFLEWSKALISIE
jgi:hypothetical protein